jgi:hypothetical protein
MAEGRPRTPHRMTIQNGFCANANSSTKPLKEAIPTMNMTLRPSRSASWPSASWKAPATREVDAVIHEISPCVMPRSRPMVAVTIMLTPIRNDDVAVATVAWKTKDVYHPRDPLLVKIPQRRDEPA